MTEDRKPADHTTDGADTLPWDVGLDDGSGALMRLVGRQIKMWRESVCLTQTELGAAIGYGEEMVSKVERGIRIPKAEFLDNADRVVKAGGKLSALNPEVAGIRYPRKVRDLALVEARAVELGAYGNSVVHCLLQTEEYARANLRERRPAYGDEVKERLLAARVARQEIFERRPAPLLTFVQEESVLRRPLGGTGVRRRQLEHLLELGGLQHVQIQVMSTETEEHAGLGDHSRYSSSATARPLGTTRSSSPAG